MTTEMKGHSAESQEPPKKDDDFDPASLAAIRQLLETEEEPEPAEIPEPPQAVETPTVPEAEVIAASEPSEREEPAPERVTLAADPLPVIRAAVESVDAEGAEAPAVPASKAMKPKKASRVAGRLDRVKARILGYRPTPKHITIAAFALLVFLRPWLVVGVFLLSLLVFIGVFLILGYDGFWKKAMGLARWYAGRRPDRAKHLHRKLDDFAVKWDAFLDRFPEGSVDALYLPDFGDLATADARHEEALSRRLSTLRENGT